MSFLHLMNILGLLGTKNICCVQKAYLLYILVYQDRPLHSIGLPSLSSSCKTHRHSQGEAKGAMPSKVFRSSHFELLEAAYQNNALVALNSIIFTPSKYWVGYATGLRPVYISRSILQKPK